MGGLLPLEVLSSSTLEVRFEDEEVNLWKLIGNVNLHRITARGMAILNPDIKELHLRLRSLTILVEIMASYTFTYVIPS